MLWSILASWEKEKILKEKNSNGLGKTIQVCLLVVLSRCYAWKWTALSFSLHEFLPVCCWDWDSCVRYGLLGAPLAFQHFRVGFWRLSMPGSVVQPGQGQDAVLPDNMGHNNAVLLHWTPVCITQKCCPKKCNDDTKNLLSPGLLLLSFVLGPFEN